MNSAALVLQSRGAPAAVRASSTERARTPGGRSVDGLTTCRVLIANRQPLVRHGVRALLASEPDLALVGETDDGAEAVRLAARLRPDVVLVDLLMPGLGGIPVTRTIRAEVPGTQVIVMTGVDEDAPAIEAIRAGAVAYLSKDARADVLLRAIRGAGAGQVGLPMEAAARLLRIVGRRDGLTEREAEVLRLVARGLPNKQVARELGVTQSTVKSHVGSILAKLSLPSRTQLALYAARTGLVALERDELETDDGRVDEGMAARQPVEQRTGRAARFSA